MATHSSILAWRIPGTEEPVGLLSMGLHRVGHDLYDLAAAAAATDFVTWPLVASADRDKERRSLLVGKCSICNLKKDLLIFLRNFQVSEIFS